MVAGMATEKITITLDSAAAERIRRLVHDGKAPSVSGFVQRAVDLQLEDMDAWAAMLAAGLEETGGPMTSEERRWADRILDGKAPGVKVSIPRARRRKAA